jgi:hypothetical protein
MTLDIAKLRERFARWGRDGSYSDVLPELLDLAERVEKYEKALREIAQYKPIDFGGATKLIARKALEP